MEDKIKQFQEECWQEIIEQGEDTQLKQASFEWFKQAEKHKYGYHFTWMGRPIIQLPQDIMAMQELIWQVQPDVIVETGIAHGGSLIFYSSMLELLNNGGFVIGVDIDIREHNRREIEKHPMYKNIKMIQGSSIDDDVVNQVKALIPEGAKVLVALDSCHTHAHVLEELRKYSPLVEKGSYLVCMDTIVEYVPEDFNGERPWGKGDNPMTAMEAFLKENDRFEIDESIDNKILISESPRGFLKCVK